MKFIAKLALVIFTVIGFFTSDCFAQPPEVETTDKKVPTYHGSITRNQLSGNIFNRRGESKAFISVDEDFKGESGSDRPLVEFLLETRVYSMSFSMEEFPIYNALGWIPILTPTVQVEEYSKTTKSLYPGKVAILGDRTDVVNEFAIPNVEFSALFVVSTLKAKEYGTITDPDLLRYFVRHPNFKYAYFDLLDEKSTLDDPFFGMPRNTIALGD